jgi:hypothetical protein
VRLEGKPREQVNQLLEHLKKDKTLAAKVGAA